MLDIKFLKDFFFKSSKKMGESKEPEKAIQYKKENRQDIKSK